MYGLTQTPSRCGTSPHTPWDQHTPATWSRRYGLAIGASLAWLVRIIMALCSPIAWPLGKLLDVLLGTEQHVLFRRKQLKALVDLHGEGGGMGGKLSEDEIKIITGGC